MDVGIYLTGACGPSQALYRARNEEKRGRGSAESVEKQILMDTKLSIEAQEKSGVSFFIDPQFRFFDLLQPFAQSVPQVEVGPQENWFNNNVFYRRPQIHGPLPKIQESFLQNYLHVDLLVKNSSTAILPSPYTLLSLSDLHGYSQKTQAIRNLAELLAQEAQYLADLGFQRIQLDEPTIVMKQSLGSIKDEDLKLLELGLAPFKELRNASCSLHTYFGDVAPLLPFLLTLPVNCIGVDAAETRLQEISKHSFAEKELALGLINARSPAMEDPKELVVKAQQVFEATSPKKLWITSNTGLEYIGWTLGMEKLSILEKVKRGCENESHVVSCL